MRVTDEMIEELRADEMTAEEILGTVLRRPEMFGLVSKEGYDCLKAERDAALAAIERVREIHQLVNTQSQYPMPPDWKPVKLEVCSHCKRPGAGDALHPWPCPTIAALAGAPEPEVKP